MSVLRTANLVEARKTGRWVYYRLSENHSDKAVMGLISWLETTLSDDPTIGLDTERLELILKRMPTDSCID
jgi:DNA-binding transcriptional ArsR family regulator